jgi:uncharacterized protein
MTLHFLMAGASGFLGTQLRDHLTGRGHRVTRLVRRLPTSADEAQWDPDTAALDQDLVASADVVVNLAGSPTAGNPHSKRWAREHRRSRVVTTRVLAEAIAGIDGERPAYLAQNGISFYGDQGDTVVTEDSPSVGDAHLTSVSREWQAATEPATQAGARVCVLRTSPVQDHRSAPLKQLVLATRLGLGATFGSGRQHAPCISLRDWIGAVTFLAEHDHPVGPVNLCCPITPTNQEYTKALADAVHRKAFLKVPVAVLGPAAGALAPELLGSINAVPRRLLDAGYAFQDPDVEAVIAAGLA